MIISHIQLKPSYERMDYPLGGEEMNDSQMTGELETIIVSEYNTRGTIWFTSCDDHHVVFVKDNKTNAEISLSYLPRKKIVNMKVHALLPSGF